MISNTSQLLYFSGIACLSLAVLFNLLTTISLPSLHGLDVARLIDPNEETLSVRPNLAFSFARQPHRLTAVRNMASPLARRVSPILNFPDQGSLLAIPPREDTVRTPWCERFDVAHVCVLIVRQRAATSSI